MKVMSVLKRVIFGRDRVEEFLCRMEALAEEQYVLAQRMAETHFEALAALERVGEAQDARLLEGQGRLQRLLEGAEPEA